MNKKPMPAEGANHIAVFQETAIRRTWHNEEWWFAVADVVAVLTDSVNPGDYIKKMRLRDNELSQGWGQIVTPLRIETEGGVQRLNCANTEGLFRIIQSIPSPRAEPFKRWLAQVGYERVKEIENPGTRQCPRPRAVSGQGLPAGVDREAPTLDCRAR